MSSQDDFLSIYLNAVHTSLRTSKKIQLRWNKEFDDDEVCGYVERGISQIAHKPKTNDIDDNMVLDDNVVLDDDVTQKLLWMNP